jgi:hypothetical protein
MSETAKTAVLNSAREVAPRLTLTGKKGRLGARYTVGTARAELKAIGPWQLIEYDTERHIITSKGLQGSRQSRQADVTAGRSLRIRGGARGTRLRTPAGPRFYVRHPGTKGQYPWKHGVDKVVPQLPAVAAKVYRAQIERVFR